MAEVDVATIRGAVGRGQYLLSLHARQRKGERQVTDDELKLVILEGDVIEEYPQAKPYPKCLLMKHIRGEPLYVSCSFNGEKARIITTHWYDPEKWLDPWTRRKTP